MGQRGKQPAAKKHEHGLDAALENLGECFITGVSGTELSEDSGHFLSQSHIGGVIFFAHNYRDPLQVAEFVRQIQECRNDFPLWISVDQEGGRVQRFKDPFTQWPSAKVLSEKTTPKKLFLIAEAQAKELRAVGINLNFCPVADIQTNPKNPVIGDRAFGETEEVVSKMVTAVVRGHLISQVQPCVKHFPGHGDTDLDSHLALPRVSTSLETLLERELKPFTKAFKSRCNFVMVSHVLTESIDPDFPASLSKKTLQDLLRDRLRYQKIIVSDDLEMKAITDHYGADQVPVLALSAGCDLLIYRNEKTARSAYEATRRALENGSLDPDVVLASVQRLRDLKNEVLESSDPYPDAEITKIVGSAQHLALLNPL